MDDLLIILGHPILVSLNTAIIVFGCLEFFMARNVFRWVRERFGGPGVQTGPMSAQAILKGVLERTFLFVGLLLDYPVVIVAFGAFKLGTRLSLASSDGEDHERANDYFLIGNLLSLLVVFVMILGHKFMLHLLLNGPCHG